MTEFESSSELECRHTTEFKAFSVLAFTQVARLRVCTYAVRVGGLSLRLMCEKRMPSPSAEIPHFP